MAWLQCEKIDNQTAFVDLEDSQAYVIVDPDCVGGKFTIKVFKNDAVWGIIGKTDTFHEAETVIASMIHLCEKETDDTIIADFIGFYKKVKEEISKEKDGDE